MPRHAPPAPAAYPGSDVGGAVGAPSPSGGYPGGPLTPSQRIGSPDVGRTSYGAFLYSAVDIYDMVVGVAAGLAAAAASGGANGGGEGGSGLPPPTPPPRPAGHSMLPPGLVGPSVAELRGMFAELGPRARHGGLDDALHPWFAEERLAKAERAAAGNSIPACRAFLRFGCPQAVRPRLWVAALAVEVGERDTAYFERLCAEVERRDLLSDILVRNDVQSVANGEDFFLFDEPLRAVMLALSRDPAVPALCALPPHPLMQVWGGCYWRRLVTDE